MISGMVLAVFSERMCGARPCKKHRLDMVFAMFEAHWPFQKKMKNQEITNFFDIFCGRALGTNL